MTTKLQTRMCLALVLALSACADDTLPEQQTDGATGGSDEGSTSAPTDGLTSNSVPDSTGDDGVDGGSTSTGPTDDGSDDASDDGDPPGPPLPCPEEWACKEDEDGDGKPISCDNAPDVYNPEQGDIDFDSIGDAVDLCPTVQSLTTTADSDKDGIGNDCDVCRRPVSFYMNGSSLPARYAVRSIPLTPDSDGDGIGDACDNCPSVPNCLDFGNGPGLTPFEVGMPLDDEEPGCQADADGDGVGDACEGEEATDAAGPVGFASADDFDQDGLPNAEDGCPRLAAALGTCGSGDDCPADSACTNGVCNHPDPDGDGVGTACDTCPFAANPGQVEDGQAALDDEDGDFIGAACEPDPGCQVRAQARPLRFYDVAVGGYCCTTTLADQRLTDPDGNPLGPEDLPVDPDGVTNLPPGCDEALAAAGVSEAMPLTPADVGGVDALWDHRCLIAAPDQDFDGIGDICDLCPFAFDPTNTPFVDNNGMTWPNDGAFCNGEYACMDRE